MAALRVLVVDDEPQIRRALRVSLRANGYEVEEATTGEAALDAITMRVPDLVVLDLRLPDINGAEVCRRIREWSTVPIIVLSVQEDDVTKVNALDQGADDYITKPFSIPELLARMRVALRHSARVSAPGKPILLAGHVQIDLAQRLVTKDGAEMHLTPTEYGILRYLAEHAGRVITHGQLLRAVMGEGYEDAFGSLRVFIASLRKKLETNPATPTLIVTEPGIGYRLQAE